MIRTFSASLDKLYDMLSFIREHAESVGFDSPEISKIELATEEAIVNIVSYGYPNATGMIEINCSYQEEKGFKIVIKDFGAAYNPICYTKQYDVNVSVESRKVGGFGVYFMLKIMDQVNYSRENDVNVLTLIKNKAKQ